MRRFGNRYVFLEAVDGEYRLIFPDRLNFQKIIKHLQSDNFEFFEKSEDGLARRIPQGDVAAASMT